MASDNLARANGHGIYKYEPNIMVAIIAAGLFGVGGVLHLYVMCRKRTWFYMPIVVGAFSMLPF
jgi:hypothetical protein